MDPITLAITNALANLSQVVISDAYQALKAALQKKYGVRSELVEAVDKLEEKPESKARQAMLQEAVEDSNANEAPELKELTNTLLERIKNLPGGTTTINQHLKIKGNRNIVTGQGDVTVNE